ncbi:MAG: serine/threonine-protein kinase [Candidatus Sumerlaeia bacterium]|nr:serine/threonine-protein kinase [Candidatus Sumerlaeia bacterium]
MDRPGNDSEPAPQTPPPADLPQDPTQSYIPRTPDPADSGATAEFGAGSRDTAPLPAGGSTVWRVNDAPTEELSPPGPGYELRRVIGRGGMGEVWEAVQVSLGRVVAVKRLRGDEGDPQSRAERTRGFRQEAVISARLEHPNIVPVHDLGQDTAGRPLMAMKLVAGASWDRQLRQDFESLPMEERLARHLPILVSTAQAVAFAHSRGVVHRDLKPSQVMVGAYGEVQLMDWGLALIVGDAEEELRPMLLDSLPSPATASNPAGTPALMAPEQTFRSAEGIGPWTDVFLLGGTLYFILTGRFPFDSDTANKAFAKARECDFELPSKRAPEQRIPEELERVCLRALAREPRDRHASALEFVEEVRGFTTGATRRRDSEALSARAAALLEGPGRATAESRYAAHREAGELLEQSLRLWAENPAAGALRARNLGGWAREEIAQGDLLWARLHIDQLSGAEPAPELERALAQAHGRRRRARMLARGFAAAALVLLAAAGAFAWRASIAQQRALRAEERRRDQENLQRVFARINELRSRELDLAARLEAAIPAPEQTDLDTPERRARIDRAAAASLLAERDALARERDALLPLLPAGAVLDPEPFTLLLGGAHLAFHSAEDADGALAARELYRACAALRPGMPEPLLGEGMALFRAGRPVEATTAFDSAAAAARAAYGERHPLYDKALALAAYVARRVDPSSPEAIRRFGDAVALMEPEWIDDTITLAERYAALRRHDNALAVTTNTLAAARRLGDAGRPALIEALRTAAKSQRESLRPAEAERHLREALDAARAEEGVDSLLAAAVEDELGQLYHQEKRYPEAEAQFRKGLEVRERLAGPDSEEYAQSISNLAAARLLQGAPSEAYELLLRALEIQEAVNGPVHPETHAAVHNLAAAERALGRHDEAIANMRRSLAIAESIYGPESPQTAASLMGIAAVLHSLGRSAEGVAPARQGYETFVATLGRTHPRTLGAVQTLALATAAAGNDDATLEAATLAIEVFSEALGDPVDLRFRSFLLARGAALVRLGRLDEGAADFERARDCAIRDGNPDNAANTVRERAKALASTGRFREAGEVLIAGFPFEIETFGAESLEVGVLHNLIAEYVSKGGDDAAAEPYFRAAIALGERLLRPDSRELAMRRANFAVSLNRTGGHAEAESYLRPMVAIYQGENTPNAPRFEAFTRRHLANALAGQGRKREAADELLAAAAFFRTAPTPSPGDLVECLQALGFALRDLGDAAGAREALEEAVAVFDRGGAGAAAKSAGEARQALEALPVE